MATVPARYANSTALVGTTLYVTGIDSTSAQGKDLYAVDLEGACRGSLACATCHLILTPEWYARLPPAAASEQQLLDVAFGMTTTSRLGCQLTITQDLDGCVAHIADRNRDLALSPLT
ncbi:MAG: hypothetical protein ACOYLX_15085 [Burkholderiaceae bacterium]